MYRHNDAVEDLVAFISDTRGFLFHRSDQANLASIEEHGLLSKQRADEMGVKPLVPGGDGLTRTLDRDYGLWNYVFLSFITNVVMPSNRDERHRRRPRLLGIDPKILFKRGTQIALGRANHRGTDRFPVKRAVQVMDCDVFAQVLTRTHKTDDLDMKRRVYRVFDYEVLIPTEVPIDYITLLD